MILEVIRNEYQNRKRLNARYSLRAFAHSLGIQPGRLSEYLSEKRKITEEVAEKIAIRLGRNTVLFKSKIPEGLTFIEDDVFTVIADWQHFAILSLMDTKDFKSAPEWIAKRLGITDFEAKESLRRLERVGAITIRGKLILKTQKNIYTGSERESGALKLSHTQSLQQAIEKMHEIPVELRDITSMTMAINIKKLPLAKKLITEFRRKVCNFLEDGNRSEVYNLNIQLVPVSQLSEREKK